MIEWYRHLHKTLLGDVWFADNVDIEAMLINWIRKLIIDICTGAYE